MEFDLAVESAVRHYASVTNTVEYGLDSQSPSPGAPALRLEPVASRCAAGDCPTVYRSSRGTLVVQGYAVTPNDAGITVPSGELLVEIPPELLAAAVQNLSLT